MLSKIFAITLKHSNINRYSMGFLSKSKPKQIYSIEPRQKMTNRTKNNVNITNLQIYFNQKIPLVEDQCATIIKQIRMPNLNLKNIQKSLDTYLELHSFNRVKQRTLPGLRLLLLSISISKQPSLVKYRKLIMEHMSRFYIQEQIIDKQTVPYFIIGTEQLRRQHMQKTKNISLLYSLMKILKNSFKNVQIDQYVFIMKIINADNFPILSYIGIVNLIQEHIHQYCLISLKQDTDTYKKSKQLNAEFILNLTNIYKLYGTLLPQHTQSLFHFMIQKYFPITLTKSKFDMELINTIYRNFPVEGSNQKGISFKTLLLNHIISLYEKNSLLIESFIYEKRGAQLFSSIITHLFYQQAKLLRYHQFQQCIYLPASQLKQSPTLPDFFWNSYKKYPSQFQYQCFLRNTLRDCYPNQFQNIPSKQNLQTIPPIFQSQMKIRMESALNLLNFTFQKQALISGRYVDFLLPNKIIIELDGVHHFVPRKLAYDDNTQYRNLHLLHAGYKLVIINIYQYNILRQIEEVAQYLTIKLNLIKSHNAVLVL